MVDRTFHLSVPQRAAISGGLEYLEVWSALLDDSVPLRLHWPLYAELRINGSLVKVVGRAGQQDLGANGRDEAIPVSTPGGWQGMGGAQPRE